MARRRASLRDARTWAHRSPLRRHNRSSWHRAKVLLDSGPSGHQMLTRWPGTRVMSRLPWHLLVLPRAPTRASQPTSPALIGERACRARAQARTPNVEAFLLSSPGVAAGRLCRRRHATTTLRSVPLFAALGGRRSLIEHLAPPWRAGPALSRLARPVGVAPPTSDWTLLFKLASLRAAKSGTCARASQRLGPGLYPVGAGWQAGLARADENQD